MFDILIAYPFVGYVFALLITLAVGSFLNVLIYRIPLMLKAEWREDCRALLKLPEEATEKMSLFYPRRSFCPNCNTTIKAWHNIPLFSYIMLLGRCAYCHASISLQYPIVEFLSAATTLACLFLFGFTIKACVLVVFFWILIVLCFIDIKHQLLPDGLTLGLLWIGLLININSLFIPLHTAVESAALAYGSLWLFIQLFYLLTGKIGMGNGDFKLFAAFGAWFGWQSLIFILIISSLVGSIIGIAFLKFSKQNKETPIPFGPFLCIAAVIYVFFGEQLIPWYLSFYG